MTHCATDMIEQLVLDGVLFLNPIDNYFKFAFAALAARVPAPSTSF